MRNAVNSIHFVRVQLPNTMPMDSGAIGHDLVCHMNDELIAPTCLDRRPRISTIEVVAKDFLNPIGFDLID